MKPKKILKLLGLGRRGHRIENPGPLPVPTIETSGNFDHPAAARLHEAFVLARAGDGPLPGWIRTMRGMSGRRYRSLINRLVSVTPQAGYLEVGSWTGSTACAALHGNTVTSVCIDDWSKYDGPKDKFLANIDKCLTDAIDFRLVEGDCRTVDYATLGPFNLFFYDGPHSEEDTRFGIAAAQPALAPVHTLIVDDWNWEDVREGTLRALNDLGLEVIASIAIRTTLDGSQPAVFDENSDWHNGYFLAVCRK